MHSDAASQGGGWWQGCGAAYCAPSAAPQSSNSSTGTADESSMSIARKRAYASTPVEAARVRAGGIVGGAEA